MEVLAPAGGMESVKAAVLNGADAVYLGQKGFSARQNAENFDSVALKQAVSFCHLYGAKVYQTVNTVIFEEELPALSETLRTACEAGVDALIVQDFGVLSLVRELCPAMPVHASTQMTVHTPKGAQLMKDLGVSRVVLAREMTLKEIKEVIDKVEIETEVFVHGALCMSVSGQCYMSAAIGGRSGNKGSCAGSCRLPFRVKAGQKGEAYDLSLKDLCAAGQVERLKEIGVTSLKIEGRMKRPEYVAAASAAYSRLIKGESADLHSLRAVFSRSGFTDGYLENKIDGTMFGFRGKEDVTAATGEILGKLQETYRKTRQVFPVSLSFEMQAGCPAKFVLQDQEGHRAEVWGEVPQTAVNKPTTEELAKEALEKLGDTPYYPETFTTDIAAGLMLPKSKLNALRRQAVEQLNKMRTAGREVPFFEGKPPCSQRENLRKKEKSPSLRGRFSSFAQLPKDWKQYFNRIYLPVDEVIEHADLLLPEKGRIILEPDRVLFGTEEKTAEKLSVLRQMGFQALALSNPAHLQIGKELGFQLCGTHFLNITNSRSGEQYGKLGVMDTVLSMEGSVAQLRRISVSGMETGVVVYGSLPLMIVRNCPVRRYESCARCRGKNGVTDRLGNRFPVMCNRSKYSEILNCKCLDLSDKQEDFTGFDFLELYFTQESQEECASIAKRYLQKGKPEGDFTRGLYYRKIR